MAPAVSLLVHFGIPMAAPNPTLFRIAGFPCSGLDWVGRLLALHPMVAVVEGPSRVGALGGESPRRSPELAAAGVELLQQGRAALAAKPGATHLGVITLAGDSAIAAPEIMVLRDGRDVLVAWTIRQLEEEGACLRRFLGKHEPASRIPELHRRFRADPADVLERHPGLLLADYDWVRYGAHLWDDEVTGYFGAMGAIADGKISGDQPLEVRFEAAREDPAGTYARALAFLQLPPAAAAPTDPGLSPETDPGLRAEWEVGRWKRYFTPQATKLFKMDAWSALESVTENYGDDEWEGECAPVAGR